MNTLLAQIMIVNFVFVVYIVVMGVSSSLMRYNQAKREEPIQGPMQYLNGFWDKILFGELVAYGMSDYKIVKTGAEDRAYDQLGRDLFLMRYFGLDITFAFVTSLVGVLNLAFEIYMIFAMIGMEQVSYHNLGLVALVLMIASFGGGMLHFLNKTWSYLDLPYQFVRWSGYATTLVLTIGSVMYLLR